MRAIEIGIGIIIVIATVGIILAALLILTTEYTTIEGEVTDVETILNDDGSIKYLLVTLNDDESYKIGGKTGFDGDMDFTVNSQLIIELTKDIYSNDVWTVKAIIKAPSGEN